MPRNPAEILAFIEAMVPLARRVRWPLAIKILPALYAAGLIFVVIRLLPASEFGQYGMAFAYINLCAGLSRAVWQPPLITQAAIGQYSEVAGPALRFASVLAMICGLGSVLVLPLLGVDIWVAVASGVILLILVPRDFALGLAQAGEMGPAAFGIEAAYFVGAFSAFVLLALTGRLTTAFDAVMANVLAACLSAAIGTILFRHQMLRWRSGSMTLILRTSRHLGFIAAGDMVLQQADTLVIGMFFTPAQIAPYVAARTLVRLYTIFSQSVNFVLLPIAARLSAAREYVRLRHRTLLAIAILFFGLGVVNLIVWLAAGWLLPVVLGAKYLAAVPYFRVLLFITLLEPAYSLITNTLVGAGRPGAIIPVTWSAVALELAAMLVLLNTIGLAAAPYVIVLTYALLFGYSISVLHRTLGADPVQESPA